MSINIISWNVNGIRAAERKGGLAELIQTQQPHILLLQEVKANRDQLSAYLVDNPDYLQYYNSAEKKGYAGTSAWVHRKFAQQLEGLTFLSAIPDAPNLDEGRVAHLQFTYQNSRYDIFGIYFPNGGKSEQAWQEKLVFYDRTRDYINTLRAQGHQVVVTGDFNVAHNPIDLARPKQNDGKVGFHPRERAWMDALLKDGWVDVYRQRHPQNVIYSWWAQRGGARARNVGWRIDYFVTNPELLSRVEEITYLNDALGSDHCPVQLRLADVPQV